MAQKKIKSDGSVKAIYRYTPGEPLERPLIGLKVPAGFPSPASDFLEGTMDLNEYLIKHPSATFFARVGGDSMEGIGIYPDDIVIVDRAVEGTNNKVVLAIYDGEFTIKRLHVENGEFWLLSENEAYPPIHIDDKLDFSVWGVVTAVIRKL
ncbi:MAG: translesion error-prone DNA polymerase V autoproteolytic subunit [Candidatus Cloacimonadaceae bacterium]|jgi:DNA polymerase V|nr:translesion error-prone DNA polymerase V autoproteolytic subunit [Candidatus Cloacimonadota bacterium]MDX9949668.1 translesion error-prone DNA polymerase V autoproteolytic subunit [Candidatus Syntrophosphaera sp.]NLN85804.1 translesion error-prone DNA polymerase V autoproteolytic subunit [Candidatus Cloacimonadota bacterium]